MFDILGKLNALANAVVVWTRPPSNDVAGTDGKRIWIDPSLSRAEKRCVLAHEVFHLLQGHTSCQPPAVERQVRLEVAQFLLSYEDLQHVAWSSCPAIMAEELDVTEQVLLDRLETLDSDQIRTLWPPEEHIA